MPRPLKSDPVDCLLAAELLRPDICLHLIFFGLFLQKRCEFDGCMVQDPVVLFDRS